MITGRLCFRIELESHLAVGDSDFLESWALHGEAQLLVEPDHHFAGMKLDLSGSFIPEARNHLVQELTTESLA